MPTIAELQINVNSQPLKEGTAALENFSTAAEKASRATKAKQQADDSSSSSTSKAAVTEKQLADIIDYQSRKLSKLAEQRELVAKSGLKDSNKAVFEELNRVIDANIALVMRQGNALDVLAAKQDREVARLQNVAAAYDPVQRAINTYERNVKSLDDGYAKGTLSLEQYNAALASQAAQLEKVKAAQPGSSASMAKEYDDALRAVLPYRTELENLTNRQRALDAAKAAGKITTPQQIKDYDDATAAIKRQTLEYQKRIEAGNNAGITFKQEQAALRGLPAQFTDIVVSLQGGQAPLTVLLQQGGQIKDTFGGIGPAIKATGGAILDLINPISVIATLIAGVAIAAYQGSEELNKFNKAAVTSAGASGVSASQFTQYRDQLDGVVGTARKAAEVLTELEASGKVSGDLFLQVGEAAIKWERATGDSIKSVVDDFASLAKDPVNAAVALDEKYKFLTASVLLQADALVQQGKEQEAVTLLQGKMAEAAQDAAERMNDNLNSVGKTLKGLKDGVSEVIDEFFKLGRLDSSAERLNNLMAEQKSIELTYRGSLGPTAASENLLNQDPRYKENQKAIEQLKQRIQYEGILSEQEKESERIRKEGNAASDRFATNRLNYLSGVEKAQVKLNKVEEDWLKIKASAQANNEVITAQQKEYYEINRKGAQKALDDVREAEAKKAKGPSSPADTRQVQEVKSNLAVITSEYDGYYKKITTLREANVISDEAAYYAQKAILDAQAKATDESYAKQIDAIKALQGSKKNSVSTNISLDNQLTKAEAARLKAQQDFATKQDQIAAKENGRVKEQTARINEYRKALEQQVESLRKQGERAVTGLGQGTRRRGLNDSLNNIDDKFDTESLNLASQYGDGSRGMSFEEYSSKLEDLKKNHDALRETAVKNYEDMGEAQKDFTLGASAAWEDYFDNASNFAGKMQDAFSGVFSDLTDSLYDFVTTGKLSFSDLAANFAKAVLRMGVEWAAAQTLRMLGITAEKTLVIGAEAAKASAKVAGNTLAATSSVASNTKIVASEVTSAGTTFTSWLPAALVKSVGTGGAAAIIGGAALVAAFALSKGLKKGFSNGGYTGDGGVNDPAGIVHKGEVVWSQKDIQRAGGVAAVESLRKGGTSPSISGSGGMSKGGDVNIPINVQVQGQPGMSDAEALKQAKVTADTVRGMMLQVIQQQKRPGGLLA